MNPLLQAPVPVPKVQAPSIDGLSLEVPKPKTVTPEDIALRLEEHRRTNAVVTHRKAGDMVGPYDEVCVDILGYCEGKLVPRSAQFNLWLRIDQPWSMPELSDAVKRANVGDGLKIRLDLPKNFIVPALRGQTAVYLVDVKAARQLKLPKLDDPKFLAKVGGAKTLPAAMNTIGEELGAEYVHLATLSALQVAVDAVSKRAEVKLPPKFLQQEVWNAWRETEGKLLSERGLVGQEQTDSFDNFKEDQLKVDDVERRVRNTLVMKAVAEAHEAELTPDRLVQTAERWVTLLGLTPEKLEAFKHADSATKNQTGGLLIELAAAELVLERSTIAWVEAK